MIRLMRSSAFLNGRNKVDLMDCFLMNHCLWSIPDHQQIIRDILADAIAKHGYTMAVNLSALKKEVQEFQQEVEKEIRIPNTRTVEKLIPVEDEYFRLDKQDNKFQGSLVKIDQYRTLSIDEPSVTNFFDEQKNLVNKIMAAKGKVENSIEVHHNSATIVYRLETRLIEKTEYLSKKPHDIVQKFWDERFQQLNAFISQQLENMKENQPVEIDALDQNLFVDPEFAEIVKKNFEEVRSHLQQLQLSLEKLQFAYTNV
ncbi:hypothetical protein D5R40_33535 [Okeania hirsuta]|uniref:ATPase RavA-like AAA lid domain-containing protein n=1 Tax=Okeania hirsuta TaxID=1458930 RepID=A0A3N6QWJ9_9CYAN|nr:hypothetical protein [Okeania hirsuta]RQH17114.1 hypothetical protein D5R40_33535 [Okeania hirsuta]